MIRRKIRKQQKAGEGDANSLDISSLIDVSFLLLIYFLITSTLDPKEGDLNLTMPPVGDNPRYESPMMPTPRIVVNADGVISMQDEILDTDPTNRELIHLEDRLMTYRDAYQVFDATGSPPIELEVDDSVPGQRFIDVMNCLAGTEIQNISLVKFKTTD
ncbi:MAG: biopolymer transporter ExbD [Verrucomicrobiales bacterium]|nr:biopolymer transporter ExbD [Verrucomicrobiales bacterium]